MYEDVSAHDRAGWRHGLRFAPLLPVLVAQTVWTHLRTTRLPGAEGPTRGEVAGAGPPLGMLAIGESTAAGVGAPRHDEAFAGQLARALAERYGRTVVWHAVGESGYTAARVHARLLPRVDGARIDLGVITLGVNDAIELTSRRRWRRDLGALIDALRERLGPIPLMITGVAPIEQFPGLPRPLRDFFGWRAAVLDHETRRLATRLEAVQYLDIPHDADIRPLLGHDGIHCTPAGYADWTRHLVERLDLPLG